MPTYVVESYGANREAELTEARERALRAAELGTEVRYVRTTFLPRDETVLHVFEAASVDELRQAAGLAELAHERIVEAIEAPDELGSDYVPGKDTP